MRLSRLLHVPLIAATAASLAGCQSDPAFHEAAVSDAGVSMIQAGRQGEQDASGFTKITIRKREAVVSRYAVKAEGRAEEEVGAEGLPQVRIRISETNHPGEIPVGTEIVCTDVPGRTLLCGAGAGAPSVPVSGYQWGPND